MAFGETAEKINFNSTFHRAAGALEIKNNNRTAGAEAANYYLLNAFSIAELKETLTTAIVRMHNKIMQIPAWGSLNDNFERFS